ncbi:hypothetical protein DFH09DRAFT_1317611 [Mycena vulgaris]|nr:hypothetical protein DFH09DRAFT_1317611 [Mycena vulgaris]
MTSTARPKPSTRFEFGPLAPPSPTQPALSLAPAPKPTANAGPKAGSARRPDRRNPGDLALVVCSVVMWSSLRLILTRYAFPALARRWGIIKEGKMMSFREQGYAVVYWGVFGVWGVALRELTTSGKDRAPQASASPASSRRAVGRRAPQAYLLGRRRHSMACAAGNPCPPSILFPIPFLPTTSRIVR